MFGEEPQFIKLNPGKLENFGKTSQFICQMCQILEYSFDTGRCWNIFVENKNIIFSCPYLNQLGMIVGVVCRH